MHHLKKTRVSLYMYIYMYMQSDLILSRLNYNQSADLV